MCVCVGGGVGGVHFILCICCCFLGGLLLHLLVCLLFFTFLLQFYHLPLASYCLGVDTFEKIKKAK